MSFLEITNEKPEVIAAMRNNGMKHETIKIFERKGTEIVYSTDGNYDHVSVFNPNRPVKKSEIELVIKKFFKRNRNNINIFSTSTGVIHICTK